MGSEPCPAGPAQSGAEGAELLLGDHDRVEASPGDLHREAAELADRVADAVQKLGVVLDHEAGAVVAPGLLVAEQAQDDVAGRRPVGRGRLEERGEHHRHAAFHVEGAASPDVAVRDLSAERSS